MLNLMNLGAIPLLSDAETRSISAENPTGERGGGARAEVPTRTQTYSTPFLGYPLYRGEPGEVPKHGLYRWHILDPVRFRHDLRVTVQALGWWPNRKYEPLTDDIASVAYWYQSEPHAPFPALPSVPARWTR